MIDLRAISFGILLALAPAVGRAAQESPAFCTPPETPGFQSGFQTLFGMLGEDTMGAPTECEHVDDTTGDTLQATTTGLALYRRSTNTPTFTDGSTHWALTVGGMVTWTGTDVDPPNTDARQPLPMAEPPPAVPSPPAPSPVNNWTSAYTQAGGAPVVPSPQYPTDNRLFRLVGNNVVEVSASNGRAWDQLSNGVCGVSQIFLVLSPTFDRDNTMVANHGTPCAVSHDGGRSWSSFATRIASGYSQGHIVFSPAFAQDHRLWLSGTLAGRPSIELSDDAGSTWRTVSFPYSAVTIDDLAVTGSATGQAVVLVSGTDASRQGRYFRSSEWGVSWQEITDSFRNPDAVSLPNLTFRAGVDFSHLYAASNRDNSTSWFSEDAGVNWRHVSERQVAAVTPDGCAVLLSAADMELSCNGRQSRVVSGPPDPGARVISVATFADHSNVLLSTQHGLWTFDVRP